MLAAMGLLASVLQDHSLTPIETSQRSRRLRSGAIPDAVALWVGLPSEQDPAVLIDEAVDAAADSDVAIVVVGTTSQVESEGFDRTTLRLLGKQDALVRAVAAANPRTVVVVNAGVPVTLPWRSDVAAIVAAWFPGQEFGHALADVLSGDADPGGRLPVTWPDPLGHGLSFTRWQLSALEAAAPTGGMDGRVPLVVTNVGQRSGKSVVQVYLERISESRVDRPARWLAGLAVVRLGTTESASVEIALPRRRFAQWEKDAWQGEPGTYRLVVGLSCADEQLSAEIDVDSPG
jgi:beta-glucosidase